MALTPVRRRAVETVAKAVDWPDDLVRLRPLIADCDCGSRAMLVLIPELPPPAQELVDEALEPLRNSVSEQGVEVYPISGQPAPTSWKCTNCSDVNIVGIGILSPRRLDMYFGD